MSSSDWSWPSCRASPRLRSASSALKDGDRVVFYGDSITDQRLYTTFAETFAVTRFPKVNVTFVHSGWGGDRVTGGGGGRSTSGSIATSSPTSRRS